MQQYILCSNTNLLILTCVTFFNTIRNNVISGGKYIAKHHAEDTIHQTHEVLLFIILYQLKSLKILHLLTQLTSHLSDIYHRYFLYFYCKNIL